MAYNDLTCITDVQNTGLANCLDNLGYDAKLLVTLDSFSFASETDAENQTKYQDAINARTMFPFPLFEEVEPALEDNVVQETGIGLRIFVREGKYGGTGRYRIAMCNLIKLRSFNDITNLRAFIITGNDKVYGTSPDGVIFKGFSLSYFFQSGLNMPDGTVARMAALDYQMKSPSEMFDYGAVPQLTWSPLAELRGLIDVTVTVPAGFTATNVVVNVARDCDGEAVTGLVEGDFTMLDASGTTVLPATSFTDNADGTYTFTFAVALASEAHTVNLKSAATQTTGGYGPGTAASFTIP
jgi:hypothetical protein